MCSPIYEGGLGIRRLVKLKRDLLGKWLYRHANARENFRGGVIKMKCQLMGWLEFQ